MGSAFCHSQLYSCKESFLPITYQFLPANSYGLFSDFGRGSWALTTCLGGRGYDPISGSIYLNEVEICCNEMRKYSCFVGENTFDQINNAEDLLTAKICIQRALDISNLPYSVSEIKDLFRLSDERFERNLQYVSGEIWRISIAVGFALNRELFCYPWMNIHDLNAYLDVEIINVLKKYNKIVVIPTCRATIKSPFKKVFNHAINFHSCKEKCFDISLEERRRMSKLKEW